MEIKYRGARWFKCDLHMHTPASQCFRDRTVTPEQWVDACLEAGLHCVAVTDHNTGAWIDCIKEVASEKGLVVFPGVEITCDTSKIHLLVLFDLDKTTQNVEDFLVQCGIDRDLFASSEAHSQATALEIAKKANAQGAIVIPAHIDEFSGLGYCASKSSVEDFFSLGFINAVQVVHKEFLQSELPTRGNQELLKAINDYYGNRSTIIGEENINRCYLSVQSAINHQKRLLTFSDNPDEIEPSKHGLYGIGSKSTMIKMDETPSLESLRQALMMRDRTINMFDVGSQVYKEPSLWIRRIVISNTTLNEDSAPFVVDFNPQLTTIIGGRGSGKSSILRFLRGAFSHVKDLENLHEVEVDHNDFFKIEDNGHGVLTEDTEIEVYFVRDSIDYKITYQQKNLSPIVERFDIAKEEYEVINDEGFIDFFQFEEYSQKQIYSIAQRTNSLRNRIDTAIPDLMALSSEYHQERQNYRSLMEAKRSLEQAVKIKGKLATEVKDLRTKIELLKQSGISTLITQQQNFLNQRQQIKTYLESVRDIAQELVKIAPSYLQHPSFPSVAIEEKYRQEIESILNPSSALINQVGKALNDYASRIGGELREEVAKIRDSQLFKDLQVCKTNFEEKKTELESKGISSMTDFQKYNQLIDEKEKEIKNLEEKEKELINIKKEIDDRKKKIVDIRSSVTKIRRDFVSSCINDDKIKVAIIAYADKSDFRTKLRKILNKSANYDKGIETAVNYVFADDKILKNLADFKESMHLIHDGLDEGEEYGGWFRNLIRELTPSQMDQIDLIYPEDQIEMRYNVGNNRFKPLTVASAGQKTTAILTFILSFGNVPLILDQPEDDLDNRLVYDLIVDKIRKIKQHRQVIVVTHNANIPVNGDAEYVVSMSSETPTLKIEAEGAVDADDVKREICTVMEGGVDAFNIRAKRYSSINR